MRIQNLKIGKSKFKNWNWKIKKNFSREKFFTQTLTKKLCNNFFVQKFYDTKFFVAQKIWCRKIFVENQKIAEQFLWFSIFRGQIFGVFFNFCPKNWDFSPKKLRFFFKKLGKMWANAHIFARKIHIFPQKILKFALKIEISKRKIAFWVLKIKFLYVKNVGFY